MRTLFLTCPVAGPLPGRDGGRRWLGLRWLAVAVLACWGWMMDAAGGSRPNILWLTCEDTGPQLGCYGDTDARTPNLDALAGRGLRFRRAWSTVPVCAPARTAIISGMYPSAAGAEHMRSLVPMPTGTRMFPELLRAAGYYCSNNSKEDYNFAKPGRVWDESSPRAHWRNRGPGQPFFAVFNYTETHESQIRVRPHAFVHDPARVAVPPYMPDVREVREGWAQYHDQVSVVDARVGQALRELEEAGLAEDTLVFFYGDHGPGLPRGKRSACDSGLRVPLIVHFPEGWRHLAPEGYSPGGESGRLVGFVDLAPTVLSLAGIRPPGWMHGRAFAGPHEAPPARYLFGSRGRMDERYDLVRSVTDGRFVYVRNYLPHLPHGQQVSYMFETPATVAWERMFREGSLPPVQRSYWEPKAEEELYDLEADPFETVNLAGYPAHRETLRRMRQVLRRQASEHPDVGLMPEPEMLARAAGGPPGDLALGAGRRALRRVREAAEMAAGRDTGAIRGLRRLATDGDPAVRYWAATGLLIRGAGGVTGAGEVLRELLRDPVACVRVPAAEALARHGSAEERRWALDVLVELADGRRDYLVAVAALNALDALGEVAAERKGVLAGMPRRVEGVEPRMNDYLGRLLGRIVGP